MPDPTKHLTLGYPNDAYGLAEGTKLVPEEITLTDTDGDKDVGIGDMVNGVEITNSYLGDTITVNTDSGPVEVFGVTYYLSDGDKFFMSTDGSVLQPGTAAESTYILQSTDVPLSSVTPPCFVVGTRIAVPGGWALVEDLRAGDWVETLDHGPQQLIWIGQRTLSGVGASAPIEFAPGTLGNDRPLRVSPQHRVLVRDGRLAMLFDTTEALIPACHLVDGTSVRRLSRPSVTYVHLLFAQHEIVLSEGVPTESLHPGPVALEGFAEAARAELLMLMPELAEGENAYGPCARRVLNRHEARVTCALITGSEVSPPGAVVKSPRHPSAVPA